MISGGQGQGQDKVRPEDRGWGMNRAAIEGAHVQ